VHMSTLRKSVVICRVTIGVFITWVALAVFADAQVSVPSADGSWAATSQNSTNTGNPYRTTESHVKSGNKTVDRKTVEVLGSDGRYEPYLQIETETTKESPSLTRAVTRTYNPDQDGNQHVTQVVEEETRNSGDGSRTVQTTSNAGLDGRFQIAEREVTVRSKNGDSETARTTVYIPSMSGELAPSMQINEDKSRDSNGTTQTKKETRLDDPDGRWQVYEVREQTLKESGQTRTTHERVSRRDYEGKISPVSETTTEDTNAGGRLTSSSQTSSVDAPGMARDGNLYPTQSSTTVRTTEPGRIITEQQVKQFDVGERGSNSSVNTKDVIIEGSSGADETVTVTAQYPDGSPSVVSVETRKSEPKP
jgi:hypothetical protein